MSQVSPERPRAIVHLDLDAFFAAVEVLKNPDLEGRPVLIGGRPEERGVVAAASYPARAYGVHSAMPMYWALQLCPVAVVLPARHPLYRRYSRRVMNMLRELSPLVEQMSIDEAYLDLTDQIGEWEEAVGLAEGLQRRVRREVGLSASLGVATNKLVAKVASDRDKPGGLMVVQPGQEATFLAPLQVEVIWGIGPTTASKLAEMGVTTVGELAHLSEAELEERFGRNGPTMARRARGFDRRPVVTERETRSVSQERTFSRDIQDLGALKERLWRLSKGVSRRLKRAELAAGTVAIKLRYANFDTLTRQRTLTVPTDDERVIYRVALLLLKQAWNDERPVRLLGVAGRNLSPPRQLRLL